MSPRCTFPPRLAAEGSRLDSSPRGGFLHRGIALESPRRPALAVTSLKDTKVERLWK